MSQIVRIGDMACAIGLEWYSLSHESKRQKKEARALSKDVAASLCVIHQHEGSAIGGFFVGTKPKKVPSAILLLASVSHGAHVIFVDQIEDGLWAFMAVRDGSPVVGCDLIGDQETVLRAAQTYHDGFGRDEVDAYSSIDGLFENSHKTRLADVLQTADDAAVKAATLKTPPSGPGPLIVLGLLAIAGAMGLFVLQDYLQQQETEKKRAAIAILQAASSKKAPSASIPASNTAQVEGIAAAFQFKTYWDAIKAKKTKKSGWVLIKVDCRGETSCQATYQRREGTYTTFDEQPNADPYTIIDLTTITQPISFQTPHENALHADALPDENKLRHEVGTLFQRFINVGGGASLSEPQNLGASEKPATDVSAHEGKPTMPAPKYVSGEWSLNGKMTMIKELGNLPDYLTLAVLTLSLSTDGNGGNFTAKGKYYARANN